MRQVWISLMLCACTAGAAACDTTATQNRSLARSAPPQASKAGTNARAAVTAAPKAESHTVKVSGVAPPPAPAAQPLDGSPPTSWHDDRLAAPLLASALAMVMIALRRGGR